MPLPAQSTDPAVAAQNVLAKCQKAYIECGKICAKNPPTCPACEEARALCKADVQSNIQPGQGSQGNAGPTVPATGTPPQTPPGLPLVQVCVPGTTKNCKCEGNKIICNDGTRTSVPGPACGSNSAITPKVNNLGNWSGCTPFGLTKPVTPARRPTIKPCRGKCVARMRVSAYSMDLNAGACSTNIDISGPTDTDVKNTTYCAIMADLQPDATGVPTRTTYWSRAITNRHEAFHVDEMRQTLRARWLVFEAQVEAMTNPFTCTIPSPAAALATRRAAINTAFDTMMSLAHQDWLALGESPAYLDGKPHYQTLVDDICTRARTEGWATSHPCGACPP